VHFKYISTMPQIPDSMYSTESAGRQLPCSGCMSSFLSHWVSRLLRLSSSSSGSNFFSLRKTIKIVLQKKTIKSYVFMHYRFGLKLRYLEGRYLKSSSWKSIFSSFLHFVFRTRAERRLAVSPLSSTTRFLFGAFFTLSVSETSIAVTVNIE